MIEASLSAWIGFAVLVGLTSYSGVRLSFCVSWKENALRAHLPLAAGFALAPFLAGLGAVLALGLFPGADHRAHLVVISGFVLLVAVLAHPFAAASRSSGEIRRRAVPMRNGERLISILLSIWVVALIVNAVFLPLTQNDSLEYAIVGRWLYETGDLSSYPMIEAELSESGFYGPWTHPPLYVALIYLSELIQGHADSPGLMRLIAPWYAVAGTALVLSLGSLISRSTGLLSAVVFLSTPLFFLGADSALIDALPVTGFTLVLVAVIGVQGNPLIRGLVVGIALGLSLWTHSQAVLFIPLAMAALFFQTGVGAWRALPVQWGVMLLVAVLVGGWPYLRNVILFGSPISDNPEVFQLPMQGWSDWFRTGRGIDAWPAIVQYGWFKGWTVLEAYGLTFWLALLGAVLYYRARKPLRTSARHGMPEVAADSGGLVRVLLGLVACYLAGTVASTLIGLDLLIKNERYMLVLLPVVSVLAGLGLAWLWDAPPIDRCFRPSGNGRPSVKWTQSAVVLLAILSISIMQLIVLSGYRLMVNGKSIASLGRDFEQTLEARPDYLVVKYLREHTPPDSLVLSLRPANMYYADRKMISYLDPRLLPFYRERQPERALEHLDMLGVSHVHLPDYGIPPFYNSALQKILRRPEWSSLSYSADGNQVYTLRPSGLTDGPAQDVTPGVVPWIRTANLIIGGRKALANVGGSAEVFDSNDTSIGDLPLGLFNRDWSTQLTVGPANPPSMQVPPGLIEVNGDGEYGIDLSLKGQGFARIWLEQYDAFGPIRDTPARSWHKMLIGSLVLGRTYSNRSFSKRIKALPAARYWVLSIEHVGSSWIRIESARFVHLRDSLEDR